MLWGVAKNEVGWHFGREWGEWLFVRANALSNRIHLIHEHTSVCWATAAVDAIVVVADAAAIRPQKKNTLSRFIFICHFAFCLSRFLCRALDKVSNNAIIVLAASRWCTLSFLIYYHYVCTWSFVRQNFAFNYFYRKKKKIWILFVYEFHWIVEIRETNSSAWNFKREQQQQQQQKLSQNIK